MSYHDEIRELLAEITTGTGEDDGFPQVERLSEQAQRLLALPEESVEKLVQAAQLGVEAVEIALAFDPDLAEMDAGIREAEGSSENYGGDE